MGRTGKAQEGQSTAGGEGARAGGDPSPAHTGITRSEVLKAHHKLSSIWEPLVLAGPTQRLQTRVKQR